MTAMKRAKRVRRIYEVRPNEVARHLERGLQRDREKIDKWLETVDEVDDEGVPRTRMASAICRLTAYAQGDDVSRPAENARIARKVLAEVLSNMVIELPATTDALDRVDPYMSELTVICCAALGRYRIEVEKEAVPDGWLAALCGVKTPTIWTYICVKNKPALRLERPEGDSHRITCETAEKLLRNRENDL